MPAKEAIEVDTRKLRQEAITENKTSISKLTTASSKISGIKMPDDFTYKSKIEAIPTQIAEIIEKISGINKYIDQKASEFENIQGSGSGWGDKYGLGPIQMQKYGEYGDNITNEDAIETLKRLAATLYYGSTALSEGATEMFFDNGEKMFDLLGGVISTPYWGLKDWILNKKNGGKSNSNELGINWYDLAERLAGKGEGELNHDASHYDNKWQDLSYLKYNSEGYVTVKGAGSILGMIFGPQFATGTVATGATIGTSKAASGISVFGTSMGRGTKEYYTDQKYNSMKGMEEAYKSGAITKEDYEAIVKIRNMSDKEWKDYEKQVKGLPENDKKYKEYMQLKNIREMPEEWNTPKTTKRALKYGAGVGAWELGQYVLGLGLTKYGTPITRVALNTSVNALDPVVRAGINTAVDGTPFSKNMKKQGGTKAIVSGALIGGGLSGLGELLNYKSIKNEIQEKEGEPRRFLIIGNDYDDDDLTIVYAEPDYIEIAKDTQKKYWKGYVSEDEIDRVFRKVNIHTDEEFAKVARHSGLYGFYDPSTGEIHIAKSSINKCPDVIEHETNHGLGSLVVNWDNDRGLNEAATDLFALESIGDDTNGATGYRDNVKYLKVIKKNVDNVVQSIPGNENTDILKTSYLDKRTEEVIIKGKKYSFSGKELFDTVLDEIMDKDGYTLELKKQMEIADGGYYNQYNSVQVERAKMQLSAMTEEIEKKCKEYMNNSNIVSDTKTWFKPAGDLTNNWFKPAGDL